MAVGVRLWTPCCCGNFFLNVILVALLQGAAVASAASAKKASFGLRSRILSGWRATPAAAQSLEWIREVSASQTGEYLHRLVANASTDDSSTTAAAGLLRSGSAQTFHELVVLNSYYSPRIEMLRAQERRDRLQHGSACPKDSTWALVWLPSAASPEAACTAEAFAALLQSGDSRGVGASFGVGLLQFDVLLRVGASDRLAVLYSALNTAGVESLSPFLSAVDALSGDSQWRVVFRHGDGAPPPSGPDADTLTGYGFELAIKSSEYKTHAEEKKDGEGDSLEDAEEADGEGLASDGSLEAAEPKKELDTPLELDGLQFDVLLKRYDTIRSELWAFKEQLELERDTDAVLKAWEIKDIGLQASARVKASKTPLLTLMRLSQNFPAHVVGLSRTPVPEGLRKSGSQLRKVIREQGEIFSLNGRVLRPDHSELSLFPLMNSLLPSFVGIERLVRIGLPEALSCELLNKAHSSSPPDRLDWRSPLLPSAIYHVQKDKKAQKWSSSLQGLLYAWPGSLAPVRLAVYRVVFLLDPMDVSDLRSALSILGVMPLPVSLHFVLVSQLAQDGGSGQWDEATLGKPPAWMEPQVRDSGSAKVSVAEAIASSFGALLQSPPRARKYLKNLLTWATDEHGMAGRIPNTQDALPALEKLWIDCLAPEEQAKGSEAWKAAMDDAKAPNGYAANATKYASSIGAPVPSVLVNGRLMLKAAYEGQSSIYPAIGEEQGILQRAVYTGKVRSEADIDDMLASYGFAGAYHEYITPELAQRGEDSGMGQSAPEAQYVQWPPQAFLALPAVQSWQGGSEGSSASATSTPLSFFHVVVIQALSQVYLLHSFAAHMLQSEGALPSSTSHLSLVFGKGNSTEAEVLSEVAACVNGVLSLEAAPDDADPEAEMALRRQKLQLLKYLGMAVPAAIASGKPLLASHAQELCSLGISKKIDQQWQQTLSGNVERFRSTGAGDAATAVLHALASDPDAASPAIWVCNGRKVALRAGSQPVSARLVRTLEVAEAKFDVAFESADEDDEEPGAPPPEKPEAQPLPKLLASAAADLAEPLPVRAQGLVAAIRSEALSAGRAEQFKQPEDIFERTPAAFQLRVPPAKPDAAVPIRVFGILNPLSPIAQSATAALALFGMAFNAEVNLVLNPAMRHSEYPLKRYYREVMQWPAKLADGQSLSALEGGHEVGGGLAELPGLATAHTLTAAVHVMPTWLVQAYEAEHDMDNLRVVDVGDGKWCEATYVLRQLYVEGQAFILGSDGYPLAPAKGVQIDVHSVGSDAPLDDTIVMGNLGYFQVHGNPGHYDLKLKPGLSNDTFYVANPEALEVATYITPPHQFRIWLRPGRSHDDLFGEDSSRSGRQKKKALPSITGGGGGGIFDRIRQMLGGGSGDAASPPPAAQDVATTTPSPGSELANGSLPTVHVFSIASGHLYEKLLGIMMLSVRNRTKCPLHFWFIDNFLSPKFKEFIPEMAREYDFAVDFVSYKWPSWLNPQSEKQRLIWAYKVLFLDVLFPMEVEKIIFIDADQVVRADVLELWNMDLQGKVYAFTPMGDTNPDTEGFRFWKQGYWANHLQGKPYHISALYVVDLAEFRRRSTGDQLRGVYNQLSRDPNSLSNLEQDLINFAQHQVPIFSLPPEWLWCETWCSQESKVKAKTIDLCQNPLTKEPKIVMANRIIAEWQTYHDEVQRFQQGLVLSKVQSSEPGSGDAKSGKAEL